MKLATYRYQGLRYVGKVATDGLSVSPILRAELDERDAMTELIRMAVDGAQMPNEIPNTTHPLDRVELEAPIARPRRNIFCVGRNYHAHARELSDSVFRDNSADLVGWPIVFSKVPECVVGPRADVTIPDGVSQQIDYEAELAVIIGKGGKNIPRSSAIEHVFGYTIVNDVTARDVQIRHQQWDLGKSFDTFCPMGPWIVTADEIDGQDVRVQCIVNGELRQDARTRDLIFDIPALIETCSRGITLYPGDIIATGTPAGVGMGMTPPSWLKRGDVVRIEIDGLGAIENVFC